MLFNLLETGFERCLLGVHLATLPVHLGVHFPNELGNKVRCHEIDAHGIEYDAFKGAAADQLQMAAARTPVGPRTAQIVPADRGHAIAAMAACNEPGQNVTGAALQPELAILYGFRRWQVGKILQAPLDFVPKLLGNDPQLRNLFFDPLVTWVGPGQAPARAWVPDEGLTVPDEASDIEFIAEDAGTTTAMPSDSRITPLVPTWAGHTIAVEGAGDITGRTADSKHFEDFDDHGSFFGNDLAPAADGFAMGVKLTPNTVAEGDIASRPASLDPALHAAMGLGRQVLDEERIHRAFEADMQFADQAFTNGDQLNPFKLERLVQTRHILLIP